MSIDDVADEDRAALRKEWETEKRLQDFEDTQKKHGDEIAGLKKTVGPLTVQVSEIHTAVVGLQGKPAKFWTKWDKGVARIAAFIGIASMLGLGGWGLYSWIDSMNKTAAAVKASATTIQGVKP